MGGVWYWGGGDYFISRWRGHVRGVSQTMVHSTWGRLISVPIVFYTGGGDRKDA